MQLPGVIFRAIHYKPFYGTGKGENLQGVQIYITDTLDANLSLLQFYAMQVLAEMYPDHKAFELEVPLCHRRTSRYSLPVEKMVQHPQQHVLQSCQ